MRLFVSNYLVSIPQALIRGVLASLYLVVGLVASSASAQDGTSRVHQQSGLKPLSRNEEVSNVKSGIITPYGLHFLGDSKATEAIPALEQQFAKTTDELDKAQIAQVLVELKDEKTTYWDYLAGRATAALDEDTPDPYIHADDGKLRGTSPVFTEWAQSKKIPLDTALEHATAVYPGYFVFLGLTEDQRAVPILRRALSAQNNLIRASASEGLAAFKDEDSIPLIIDTARKAPAAFAAAIAEPLVYFDRSDAQAAVDQYVPKEHAQRLREQVRLGGKPLHQ